MPSLFSQKKHIGYAAACLAVALALGMIDRGIGVGFLLFCVLSLGTFLALPKHWKEDRNIKFIWLAVFLTHAAVVLFLQLSHVPALGGGADFEGYHQNAVEIAYRFGHGDFSLDGLFTVHYFPVVIGIVYLFTLPSMAVGQFFIIWCACLAGLFLYRLACELGAERKYALLAGLASALYPSYLYFGSLLLKDGVIEPLVLACLFLAVLMLKRFTWGNFIWFFIWLTVLIHFRFYIGFAVLFAFLGSWIVLRAKQWQLGLILFLFLGLSPNLVGYGYYGSDPLVAYLNKDVITTYREVVYAPSDLLDQDCLEVQGCLAVIQSDDAPSATPYQESAVAQFTQADVKPANAAQNPCLACQRADENGAGSSFLVRVRFDDPVLFVRNYAISFFSTIFGPFPWQLRYTRHLLFLAETFPLYLVLLVAGYGVATAVRAQGWKALARRHALLLPVLLFFLFAFAALSLYINNFGIITRIRIPMYLTLLAAASIFIPTINVSFKKKS